MNFITFADYMRIFEKIAILVAGLLMGACTSWSGYRADDEVVGQSVLCSALNDYCGKDYRFLYGEEKASLLEKADEETMGIWPAENSILVVDDVIVIRLGSEVQ